MEELIEVFRKKRFPDIPKLDEFEASNIGIYSKEVEKPEIAFEGFCKDPVKNPLPTPSGKIEIFSDRLYKMNQADEIPAVPKYIQEWESPFGEEAKQFPLQVIGPHYMPRVHSTLVNVDTLNEAFPQRVFINEIDARARNIKNGDKVKVYNKRGNVVLPCRLTKRILPGVIAIPQGAWWDPDNQGNDKGGCVNTLNFGKVDTFGILGMLNIQLWQK